MASGSASETQPSNDESVVGGTDPTWKYVIAIRGNKNGSICSFCHTQFKSGGITRMKYHIGGSDPEKNVKACKEVPKEIKKEVNKWIKIKEAAKNKKAAIVENIGAGLRGDYIEELSNDDDEEDDGYAYPTDMHVSERANYRAAVQASKERQRRTEDAYGKMSNVCASGASSSHLQSQNLCHSKSLRDPLPIPLEAKLYKSGKNKQKNLKSMWKGTKETLARAITKFFTYDAVSPHKAKSHHFQNMIIEAQRAGEGVSIPTPYEIKEKYLPMEYQDMTEYVERQNMQWSTYGCTIMCDGWTGPTKLSIINFMVYCRGSTVFLRSIDSSDKIKDYTYLEGLLKKVVHEVGEDNVVQIVTDNGSNFKKAGEEIMRKYKLYWTPCAAHCIYLIFEDIGKNEIVSIVVRKARLVTNYICNHIWLKNLMMQFCGGELVRPSATRFATNYICIASILKKKAGLRQCFTSDAWHGHKLSREVQGHKVEEYILDSRFWSSLETLASIYEPLYSILRIVDTEVVPTMPILHDMFHRMKDKIGRLRGKGWVVKLIEERWDKKIAHPLHMAAYFLNPKYQYTSGVGHDSKLVQAVQKVFRKLNRNGNEGLEKFGNEMIYFRDVRKSFHSPMAIKSRTTMPPGEWWDMYGQSSPNLQKIAVRILSQTAASSACERNWSTFALIHIKQRNRLAYSHLEKLVFCYYNMKLKIRDEEAEAKKVAEGDYIDLLEIAGQPIESDVNDPLQAWIMPAHLDMDDGLPDPRVSHLASEEGIDVSRVLYEEVKGSQAQHVSFADDEDNDDGEDDGGDDDDDDEDDGGDDNDGGDEEVNQRGISYSPFTGEDNYTHATQDKNHGGRGAGVGIGAIGKDYTRTHNMYEEGYGNPSSGNFVGISFESMSLGTYPSNNSNETYGYDQFDINPPQMTYDYGGYRVFNLDQDCAHTSWVNPNYPIYGEKVGSSKEMYEYYVLEYTSTWSSSITWQNYCIMVDGGR